MSILEDLWCGNIRPSEYDVSSCCEYAEALERVNQVEGKLRDTLSDEQKELFARYTESVRDFHALADYLLFQNSFRLGARMIFEIIMK
ncbi:MAG: hypothetical protein IKV90_10050 [Clostridia bacterium]|nr:hypothetical protein [Clostridia bacterium]